MNMRSLRSLPSDARGVSLVELMIALVVLAGGILAVGALFPTGTREQNKDRMLAEAGLYAQQKIEQVQKKDWIDPDLSIGRHPAGTVNEVLGPTGAWERHWDVASMPAPLDNLRRVTVTVTWKVRETTRSVTASTYTRR